jgi:tetratricopeptide (TPR) repeat protein
VLPPDETLLRNWKRWEAGESQPDEFYRPLIAKTFGTVTAAMFRVPGRDGDVLAAAGLDTLEIVSRLRASDVSPSTLEALRITADRLCCEYPYRPSEQLCAEGRDWLDRMTHVLDRRLSLPQHRELLTIAGWIALLVGCVEYDMGDTRRAETTRQAALSLGGEAGNAQIIGWAHEMQAWYALTQGDYRGAITASELGQAAAPRYGVSVQLAAQKAKAWARVGDRRQVEVALDQGRTLLESLPPPDNLSHHFVVDPTKFDFYAMDCYRIVGEDRLAKNYAEQIIQSGIDADGRERSPMRNAEARITLGVIALREGDVDGAIGYGRRALQAERRSLPSLLMTSWELARELHARHDGDPEAMDYLDQLRALSADQ